jgi:exopolyphosphatase/guanosine-5'-triphosphate,3'-diphosphate pyrophosphatase
MSHLLILVGSDAIECTVQWGDTTEHHSIPVGIDTLLRQHLTDDPPRPEDLTNAIGIVIDHLDDLTREHPYAVDADVAVAGPEMKAIAAVEEGSAAVLPYALHRDAAEDVFRTLVTEPLVDRLRNPGLEAHLGHRVVAGSCVLVAVMRALQLTSVSVTA